jgi:NAD-dependent deacetylase
VTDFAEAVEILRESDWTIALTGAGISVESGIPDFRSPGGLWDRFDPMEYAHIDAFRANPVRVWEMLREMNAVVQAARPNPAHLALAELEARGVLKAIITQNIDNLHQAAGSKRVIEFHGNVRHLTCLHCCREFPADEIERRLEQTGVFPPRCPHDGHILKPSVVFFGEAIPLKASIEANEEAERCRAILVVGTSATVFPAAALPMVARQGGAKVIEINTDPTGLSYQVAHISLFGSASEILPKLAAQLPRTSA